MTPSPGNSQVDIGFLRNTSTDPLEKKLTPWVQLLLKLILEGGSYINVHPCVKYVDY